MLCRFAAGAAIASILVAAAVTVIGLSPVLSFAKIYALPVAWCLVPLVWGLWAVAAPKTWISARLPLWGAILGCVAGVFAALVLNLPARLWGFTVPLSIRLLAVVVITLLYYFCWILVELLYRTLERHGELPKAKSI